MSPNPFVNDLFISYALIDNVSISSGDQGWIVLLHERPEAGGVPDVDLAEVALDEVGPVPVAFEDDARGVRVVHDEDVVRLRAVADEADVGLLGRVGVTAHREADLAADDAPRDVVERSMGRGYACCRAATPSASTPRTAWSVSCWSSIRNTTL